MFSLAIDTSTEKGFIIFMENEHILFQKMFPFGLNNSKYLLPEMEAALKQMPRDLKDIDFIAVGIGPGSYTGIRVGVIVAKTMAFALNKPLVTFCSLQSFVPNGEESYAAVLDAKIGGAYVLKGGETNPLVMPLNQIGEYLKDIKTLITPNALILKPKLASLYPSNPWAWQESDPNPLYIGKLTVKKFQKGEFSDGKQLELLYLRKTQAEIEKEEKTVNKHYPQ